MFPFRTPQQQLTDIIEEGRNWLRFMPTPANDAQGQLAQTLAGTNVDYPANTYEWEMRAWRLLGTPGLSQRRGLFPHPERAHPFAGLRGHVQARIGQLETILGRV